MTAYLHSVSRFSRDVRLYLTTSVLFGFTIYGVQGVLLNLYLLRLGYGPATIGTFNAVGLLAYGLFGLPAGALGTRWGARRMMIAGIALTVIGSLLLPMAEVLSDGGRGAFLMIMNGLASIGISLYLVNGMPFLSGATGGAERDHAFSAMAALQPLAAFVGAAAGGLLPGLFAAAFRSAAHSPVGFRWAIVLSGVLLGPALWALAATREAPAPRTDTRTRSAGAGAPLGIIAIFALIVVLRYAGRGATETFYNVYLDSALRLGTAPIGALKAVSQLVAFPAALAMPALVGRWGKQRTIVVGTAAMAAATLPLALVPHWAAAGAGFTVITALLSLTMPAIMVYSQEAVPPGARSLIAGAMNMAAGVGLAPSALSGGILIEAAGYRAQFLAAAALSAVSAVLFAAFFRMARPAQAE